EERETTTGARPTGRGKKDEKDAKRPVCETGTQALNLEKPQESTFGGHRPPLQRGFLLRPRTGALRLCGFFLGIEESLQVTDAGGVAKLAQGFGFDLADALARDVIHFADLLQSTLVTIHEAEAHFQNLALALSQTGEDVS